MSSGVDYSFYRFTELNKLQRERWINGEQLPKKIDKSPVSPMLKKAVHLRVLAVEVTRVILDKDKMFREGSGSSFSITVYKPYFSNWSTILCVRYCILYLT